MSVSLKDENRGRHPSMFTRLMFFLLNDSPIYLSCHSKREYLLAQIRQKDMIIESLLKQVRTELLHDRKFGPHTFFDKLHNPYVATPLSIASYRMATAPSDSSNNNVLAWLDRLRISVQDAGGKAGPGAFTDVRFSGNGGDVDDEDDEDDEGEDHDRSGGRRLTHAQRIGLVPVHEGNDCEVGEGNGDQGGGGGDDDALQSSLPDSHVPLGLIANLSLSSNKKSKSKKHRMEAKLTDFDEENLDDDNVVGINCFGPRDIALRASLRQGVANATYFMPGKLSHAILSRNTFRLICLLQAQLQTWTSEQL